VRYIIYAPDYSTRIGGNMALHFLCDALNRSGADAWLWPFGETPTYRLSWERRRWQLIRSIKARRWMASMYLNPALQTRVATLRQVRDSIVVYGETVSGNPLHAKRVVRWFLNKPGRLSKVKNFGPGELYFFYHDVFDDPEINPNPTNRLTIYAILDDIYRQTNFGPREGKCYVLRKGKDRAPPPEQLDGPVIDDLSHEETARLFNECEYCISYDMHTTYSVYAAMCGCKSVIVPEPGVSKQEWQSDSDRVGGVAYGFDDLEAASKSPHAVREALLLRQTQNLENVSRFRNKVTAFFGVSDARRK
jgi:hypothetical protein